MAKSTSQYDVIRDDIVDKFSVDMNGIYSLDDFESSFKAIDTKKKFTDQFLRVLFGLPRTQSIVDENVNREREKITAGFSSIETSSEVDDYAQSIKLRDEPALKEFIKKQQTQRKSVTARRERTEENIEIRKKDLFDNAERRISLGNYKRWSAIQNQYGLTEDELAQLQRDNPSIELS